jgi:phosphotransferase system HPr-like phosphotransfer protein
MKKAITIKLSTVDSVKTFCSQAFHVDSKILVSSLDDVYRIDGKSLMGLFSLDLTKPVIVSFEGDYEEFETYLKSVAI